MTTSNDIQNRQLEHLFEVQLEYKEDKPPVSTEGKVGEYIGSGEGTANGSQINGSIHWTLFEAQSETVCESNMFGVIETDANGVVREYLEKPTTPHKVSMGAYIFNRAAIDYIPAGAYFDFPDLIHAMMRERVVGTYSYTDYWLDIGQLSDFQKAQRDIKKGLI